MDTPFFFKKKKIKIRVKSERVRESGMNRKRDWRCGRIERRRGRH